jgi:tetratricopeptide (TPR) repeat protein
MNTWSGRKLQEKRQFFCVQLKAYVALGTSKFWYYGARTGYQTLKSNLFLFWLAFISVSEVLGGQPQASAGADPQATAEAKAPQKQAEAFVIESLHTVMRFEDDGTGTRETTSTVRILSEAAVRQFGLLSFGYSSANEDVTFPYVRVRKPDGTVIPTPPGNVVDTTAEVSREAPMFSDYHEKHITVRGLGMGDQLEYDAVVQVHHPLVPGQFWTNYTFNKMVTVLDEELEVNLPKDRNVNVKSADVKPAIREDNGRRIYVWKTSHTATAADAQLPDELPPPPVQISTFKSWEEVGRWWGELEDQQAVVTPELRAKAAELTKNAKSDRERVQALYSYVALNFRYVSISFGIGRVQPHDADGVFQNGYGDCKDKHTLLATLLKAAGIGSESALINSSLKLDPDVPSPGQFDHVISRVPLADGPVWLDTTTEVAPFGYLTFNLRDKQALVVRSGKPAILMTTPADPPFQSSQQVDVKGKLSDDGKLEAEVQWTFRNDSEIFLRAAFRNTPQDKWKDVIQSISYATGYAGDVSDVRVNPTDETGSPFQYSYHYSRKDYPDWANKRITAPLPPLGLPQLTDKTEDLLKPIKLGQPGEITLRSSVELPKGYTPQLLPDVNIHDDFADYHSGYGFKDGVLTAERRLVTKHREIPASQREDYKSFWKTVTDGWSVYTELARTTAPTTPVTTAKVPDPKALDLFNQGREASLRRDTATAIDDLEHAVKVDPAYEQAWLVLAGFQLSRNDIREGMDSLRKALALNPANTQPYKFLASQLMGQRHEQEAMEIWREVLKQRPEDWDAHANVGNILMDQKQYQEAADQFEAAVKANPSNGDIQFHLGYAYLNLNEIDKAMASFVEAIRQKNDPSMLVNIAYDLVEKNVHLPDAEKWAEQAVRAREDESTRISLESLSRSDLISPGLLGASWDTLGAVFLKEGDVTQAETYLQAAWTLTQDGGTGELLGQLYERQGKKAPAAYQFALSEAAGRQFNRPLGLHRRDGSFAVSASELKNTTPLEELSQMRRVNLGKLSSKSGSAEFWLLFAPGPKLEQIKFISGDEEIRPLESALQSAKFNVVFPDDHPARILRRGVLVCEGMNLGCDFTLSTPDMVTSTE